MRDENEKRVGQNHRISISILACVIDFDGKTGQRFDHVFSGQRSVPARAASQNPDVLEAFPHLIGKRDVFQMNGVRVERKSSQDRVFDRDRLLIDFLEHEMFVAALFRHDRIPGDVLELWLPAPAGSIQEANAVARNDGDFMVVEKQNRSRIWKHCGNI